MLGSLASLAAAFLSMDASTKANVRTTEAAKRGTWHALKVAILGGSVLGFSVPSISVFSLALLFIVYSLIVSEAMTTVKSCLLWWCLFLGWFEVLFFVSGYVLIPPLFCVFLVLGLVSLGGGLGTVILPF